MFLSAIPLIFLVQYYIGVLNKKGLWFGSIIIGVVAGMWILIYFTVMVNSFKRTLLNGNLTAIDPLKAMTTIIVGGVIGGGAGFFYPVINILGFISFACSYLIMRGVTLIFSIRYPDEITVMNASMSETNNLLRLGLPCVLSLICFLVIWAGTFSFKFYEVYNSRTPGYELDDKDIPDQNDD